MNLLEQLNNKIITEEEFVRICEERDKKFSLDNCIYKRSKAINAFKDGKVLNFSSIHMAGRTLDICPSNIRKQLAGKYKQCRGYTFELI